MSEFNIGTIKLKTPLLEEDGLLEVDIENGCGYENISLEQAKALVEFLNEKIKLAENGK